MNGLVDKYLLFKSNCIYNGVITLVKNIPEFNAKTDKLVDIIYDYLNEVFLLNRSIEKYKLSKTLNIKLNDTENSLFNLFIDYGIVDRIKLKDKSIKKSYIFIVDAINYFAYVEKYISDSADVSYTQMIKRIMKKQHFLDKVMLENAINSSIEELKAIYADNFNRSSKFKSLIYDNKFSVAPTSFGDSNFYVNLNYINDDLYNFKNKEIAYVKDNFKEELFLSNLELFSYFVIEELFGGKKNKYFVSVPDFIVRRKNLFRRACSEVSVYSVRQLVTLIINKNSFTKYENIIDEAIKTYNIGVNINDSIRDDENFSGAKYFFVNYDDSGDFDLLFKKYNNSSEFIIKNKISSKDKTELINKGVKYFVSKQVKL